MPRSVNREGRLEFLTTDDTDMKEGLDISTDHRFLIRAISEIRGQNLLQQSAFDQQLAGVRQQAGDLGDKPRRVGTIDDSVVVGQ